MNEPMSPLSSLQRAGRAAATLCAALWLAGCATSKHPAPVEERSLGPRPSPTIVAPGAMPALPAADASKLLPGAENAGKPGHGPYATFFHPWVSRRGMYAYCAAFGLTVKEEHGEHQPDGDGVMGAMIALFTRIASTLSLGTLTARHANLLYIIEKDRGGADGGCCQSGALAGGILQAREEEARRIAHELHDEAGQLLASVHIALDDLATQIPERAATFRDLHNLLDRVEGQLRQLSRELRPRRSITSSIWRFCPGRPLRWLCRPRP